MSHKLMTALILSIGLSTAALAQTTGSIQRAPDRATQSIGEAQYPGSVAGTMNFGTEMRAHWQSLSPLQQAQVKNDCAMQTSGGTDGNQRLNLAAPLAGTPRICSWVNTL